MRRVRVALLIAEAMVLAVHRDPGDRRTFAGQRSHQAEQAADPGKGLKTAVGQEAMVAQANPQAAGDPGENAKRQQADPGEAERRGQGPQVQHGDPADHRPIEPVGPDANHLALGGDALILMAIGPDAAGVDAGLRLGSLRGSRRAHRRRCLMFSEGLRHNARFSTVLLVGGVN